MRELLELTVKESILAKLTRQKSTIWRWFEMCDFERFGGIVLVLCVCYVYYLIMV